MIGHARKAGAELLVCGELNWHARLEAIESQMTLICLGHLASERPLVPEMVRKLEVYGERENWNVKVEGYRDEHGNWG